MLKHWHCLNSSSGFNPYEKVGQVANLAQIELEQWRRYNVFWNCHLVIKRVCASAMKQICIEIYKYRCLVSIWVSILFRQWMSTDIIFKKCKPSISLMALLQSLCIKLGMRVPWNSRHIKGCKIRNASKRISNYRCFKQKTCRHKGKKNTMICSRGWRCTITWRLLFFVGIHFCV